jgi:prevent-host-death family protein
MRISTRDFKTHLSRYLGEAQAGACIEITSHRKPVARLSGIPAAAGDGLSRLIAQGAVSWQGGKPAGADIQLSESGAPVSSLVLQDRA